MMYAYSVLAKRSVVVALVALVVVMSGERAQAQPGTVLSHQKISSTQGGGPRLDNFDRFGISTAPLGDLDGDGPSVLAVAVGSWFDDDGGFNRGAVWILFLNADGTVNSYQKISDTEGGFKGILDNEDHFGFRVAALSDLDGDGPSVLALAVGAIGDDDGGTDRGAVWILFLNVDTTGPDPVVTVKSHHKISDTSGDLLPDALENGDGFGSALASLGDLDGDGVGDLAVGAAGVDGVPPISGAAWILFLNPDGTVKSHEKISNPEGGPEGDGDRFGLSAASLGDLDGDGPSVLALAVGVWRDDDGCPKQNPDCNRGAVWVLFLNTNGTVNSHQKISSTAGGGPRLDDDDRFAFAASLGDLDGDGVGDLAVGAVRDDDGGFNRGAVWILFLNTDGTVKDHQKISDTQGNGPPLDNGDVFGIAGSLGDLDGDGVGDLAVGAIWDDDGGFNRGAVWVLFLDGICLWDLDASGDIGVKDLLFLLGAWGPCPPKGDCPADFDDSGDVGVKDLLTLLGAWGQCP